MEARYHALNALSHYVRAALVNPDTLSGTAELLGPKRSHHYAAEITKALVAVKTRIVHDLHQRVYEDMKKSGFASRTFGPSPLENIKDKSLKRHVVNFLGVEPEHEKERAQLYAEYYSQPDSSIPGFIYQPLSDVFPDVYGPNKKKKE